MGFLKKVGQILLKGTQIALGIGPILQGAFPQAAGPIQVVESELGQLAEVIVTVEAMGQALSIPGPDKARAAAPLIAQTILKSSLMVGKKIKDEAAFLKACTALGGDVADLLNSLEGDVQTTNMA